jgi:hypothetical protein
MSGLRRHVVTVVVAGFLVINGAGCASTRSSPNSTGARDRLARTVLAVVDAAGIPVQADDIGCASSTHSSTDICRGFTATEPVQPVTGRFTFSSHTGACPGTLTITLGPSPGYLDSNGPIETVTQMAADPCR